jgi:hypothetical protein
MIHKCYVLEVVVEEEKNGPASFTTFHVWIKDKIDGLPIGEDESLLHSASKSEDTLEAELIGVNFVACKWMMWWLSDRADMHFRSWSSVAQPSGFFFFFFLGRVNRLIIDRHKPMIEHLFILLSYVLQFEWFKML